jgi:hypothetical protein
LNSHAVTHRCIVERKWVLEKVNNISRAAK